MATNDNLNDSQIPTVSYRAIQNIDVEREVTSVGSNFYQWAMPSPTPTRRAKRSRLGDQGKSKPHMALHLVLIFADASKLFLERVGQSLPDGELSGLIDRPLSNRRRAEAARLRVGRFVQDLLEFAL